MPQITSIRIRRDTAANWTSANPTLNSGELGLETDTGLVKIGDNSTAWTSLPYVWQISPRITATKTSTYSAAHGEHVRADPSGGTFTITLPVSDGKGRDITIKNVTSSTNTITIARSSSDTIDGATSATMNLAYQSMTFRPVSGGYDAI